MKKSTLLGSIAFLTLGMSVASCSSDPDFDTTVTISVAEQQLPFENGVWLDNDKNVNLNLSNYIFSHLVGDYNIVYGFTPSDISNTDLHTPLYEFPYASASGGGVSGPGSQYLVGYWAEYLEGSNPSFTERTCRIYNESGNEFQPQSVMVCNNTYAMYGALNGTDMTPKFAPGDYLNLVAHGVHLDGTEAEATFTLINIEDTDVEKGILKQWTRFDLTELGTCTGIYFTMEGSENLYGSMGFNFPAYFCLDQLVVKE